MRPKLVHLISSLQIGGAELTLVDIVEHFSTTHDQVVIFFHNGPVRQNIEDLGIRTIQITGFCTYDPLFLYRLWRTLRAERPTKILSSLWAANFLARIMGNVLRVPVYNVIHAQPAHEGRVRNALDMLSLSLATQIITVSAEIAANMRKKYGGITHKLLVIPNGVKMSGNSTAVQNKSLASSLLVLRSFSTAGSKCEAVKQPATTPYFTLGAVGRLVPVKNFELLFKAAAHLVPHIPELKIILIGSGPEEHKLRDLVQTLALTERVQFLTQHDARDYYHLFDIFVQPSWSEGLSRALLEALAAQVPVIVSGHDKKHTIITHGEDGIVIDPCSVDELAEQILLLYRDGALREQLARAGYQLALNNYSQTSMLMRYHELVSP